MFVSFQHILLFPSAIDWLIVWLIDWLIDWLIGLMLECDKENIESLEAAHKTQGMCGAHTAILTKVNI